MESPNPTIKSLVFSQFLKCDLDKDELSDEYVAALWSQLKACTDGDSDVNSLLTKILSRFARSKGSLSCLYGDAALGTIHELIAENESARLRLYDIMAVTIENVEHSVETLSQKSLLDALLQDVSADDVLVRMNSLEILGKMCVSKDMLGLVTERGILHELVKSLERGIDEDGNIRDDMLTEMSWTSTLKFFVQFSRIKGFEFSELNGSLPILPLLRQAIQDGQAVDLQIASINCLAGFLESQKGTEYMLNEGKTLRAFVSIYNVESGDTRLECLKVISCLLGSEYIAKDEKLSKRCFELYHQLNNGRFIAVMVRDSMSVIEEISGACIELLNDLCQFDWGRRELSQSSMFMSLIFDRTKAPTARIKQWKYAIVTNLKNSPDVVELFGSKAVEQMRAYITQGAFYMPPGAIVETEF
ncbi:hypothetical protein EV182_004062, partial [Spiromyces aspiralis]